MGNIGRNVVIRLPQECKIGDWTFGEYFEKFGDNQFYIKFLHRDDNAPIAINYKDEIPIECTIKVRLFRRRMSILNNCRYNYYERIE